MMRGAVHVLTAGAMAGTAAALGLWLDPWWIGVLVAVVVDGAWLIAGRMEATLTAAALDAGRPRAVAWAVAGLSAALLVVHAVAEGSMAWGAVAVLPVVSRVLAWTAAAMEEAAITPAAAQRIQALRQQARDRAAMARAGLIVKAEEERLRLETVSRATADLAANRAAAVARITDAHKSTQGSREAVPLPTGWTVADLADTGADVAVSTTGQRVSTPGGDARVPALTSGCAGVADPLVICGEHLMNTPAVPPRSRLSTPDALAVIEQAWQEGRSVRETARRATRSPSHVQQVYTRLDTEKGPRPVPGQFALEGAAA